MPDLSEVLVVSYCVRQAEVVADRFRRAVRGDPAMSGVRALLGPKQGPFDAVTTE